MCDDIIVRFLFMNIVHIDILLDTLVLSQNFSYYSIVKSICN